MYTERNLQEDLYEISTTKYVSMKDLRDYVYGQMSEEDFKETLLERKDEFEIIVILEKLHQIKQRIRQRNGKLDLDPVIKARELKEKGEIADAYRTIFPFVQANPQDEKAHIDFGWIVYEMLKLRENEVAAYCNGLRFFQENVQVDFSKTEDKAINVLKSACLWSVRRVITANKSNANYVLVPFLRFIGSSENLFESPFYFQSKKDPGKLVVKEFFRRLDAENTFELIDFLSFDWLDSKDYTSTTFKNKEGEVIELRPFAEEVLSEYAKKLITVEDVQTERIQAYLRVLEKEIKNNPSFKWLPYYKIKLQAKIGHFEEALIELGAFARGKRHEFWIWTLFSELVSKEEEFMYQAKGLLCRANPKMIVRLQEASIPNMLERGLYENAKYEVDQAMNTLKRQGWPISSTLKKWTTETWYKERPAAKNREALQPYANEAEKILYETLPETNVFISYVNKEKGVIHFIKRGSIQSFQEGYFYMDSIEEEIEWKENHTYKFKMEKDGKRPKRYHVYRVFAGNDDFVQQFITTGSGYIVKEERNHFAFVNDVYIPAHLVKQHDLRDGDYMSYIQKRRFNKRRGEWGWAVDEVKEVQSGKGNMD